MTESPSLLVVDDELLIRDLLYDFFHGQGWDISVAESAEKALDMLRKKSFDLLLTDLKMPQMDGMALTEEVRSQFPQLPIVIMTGYPSVDTAVAALRQQVADYIIKPFNINQLHKLIKTKIERAQKRDDQ